MKKWDRYLGIEKFLANEEIRTILLVLFIEFIEADTRSFFPTEIEEKWWNKKRQSRFGGTCVHWTGRVEFINMYLLENYNEKAAHVFIILQLSRYIR